jgi:hypothetical protein
MKAKGFVFVLTLFVISACGSDTKTVTPSGSQSASVHSAVKLTSDFLMGTWTSGCALDAKRSGIYIKEYLTYDDTGEADRSTTSYLDAKCTAELYQQTLLATYKISDRGVYSETRKSVSLTPLASVTLTWFTHGQGLCEDTDWHLNEERTFSDVSLCGIASHATLVLSAKQDSGIAELTARECDPFSHTDCKNIRYMR